MSSEYNFVRESRTFLALNVLILCDDLNFKQLETQVERLIIVEQHFYHFSGATVKVLNLKIGLELS